MSRKKEFNLIASVIYGLLIAIMSSWAVVLGLEVLTWPLEVMTSGIVHIKWEPVTLVAWVAATIFLYKGAN